VRWPVGEGSRGEHEETRGTRGSAPWFTCRHGNAASPLTCYSIGIARPSAAVLSQPPQEYERESRSIARDRERDDDDDDVSSLNERASARPVARWLRSLARSLTLSARLSISPPLRGSTNPLLSFSGDTSGKKKKRRIALPRDTITLFLSLSLSLFPPQYALYTVITERALSSMRYYASHACYVRQHVYVPPRSSSR